MKMSNGNGSLLKLISGLFIIGGVVAVLNIYREAKETEYVLNSITEEYGDIFI